MDAAQDSAAGVFFVRGETDSGHLAARDERVVWPEALIIDGRGTSKRAMRLLRRKVIGMDVRCDSVFSMRLAHLAEQDGYFHRLVLQSALNELASAARCFALAFA